MQIVVEPGKATYVADSGDWRLVIAPGHFEIIPAATGGLTYEIGINLDNLATLIVEAKADAIARGIDWDGE